MVTRCLPSAAAAASARCWSAAPSGFPSDRFTSMVTASASGLIPNLSSATFSAAAESYFSGRKSPSWLSVTRYISA